MILLVVSTLLYTVIFWMIYTKLFGAEYCPAEKKVIDKAIKVSRLKKNEIFYDLGCGDGKVLLRVCNHCKKAIGIEIDPLRAWISMLRCKGKNIKIFRENMYNHNLHNANVIFIYLRQPANDRLLEKFRKELKKGTRIVSHHWTLNMKPYKVDKNLKIYAYKI